MSAHSVEARRSEPEVRAPYWVQAVERIGIASAVCFALIYVGVHFGNRFLDMMATQNDMFIAALRDNTAAIKDLAGNVEALVSRQGDR